MITKKVMLQPHTKHWFQTDKKGAVLYSFSTCVRDALDCFTDPHIKRMMKVIDE